MITLVALRRGADGAHYNETDIKKAAQATFLPNLVGTSTVDPTCFKVKRLTN
jgi:thiamine monophosphate synthase